MTSGQVANGIGSALAMVSSGVFIVTWTAVGRWWKTPTGRFMVAKAAAICFTGVITVSLTLADFSASQDWMRWVQGSLWVTVSVAFIHHTRMVYRVNRKERGQ
jgi:hypothetical protein